MINEVLELFSELREQGITQLSFDCKIGHEVGYSYQDYSYDPKLLSLPSKTREKLGQLVQFLLEEAAARNGKYSSGWEKGEIEIDLKSGEISAGFAYRDDFDEVFVDDTVTIPLKMKVRYGKVSLKTQNLYLDESLPDWATDPDVEIDESYVYFNVSTGPKKLSRDEKKLLQELALEAEGELQYALEYNTDRSYTFSFSIERDPDNPTQVRRQVVGSTFAVSDEPQLTYTTTISDLIARANDGDNVQGRPGPMGK